MCGRYALALLHTELSDLYRAFIADNSPAALHWKPRYNIAPTETIPVLRFVTGPGGGPGGGQRRIDLMRWGLIPAWSKEIGSFATFNARADTLAEKPAYRDAWRKGQRCIIPASAFYEWRKPDKQPFAVALGNKGCLSIAGLWEEWNPRDARGHDAAPILSCTIITTEANTLMASIHDRMPAIIGDEDLAKWLGEEPVTTAELAAMLKPFKPERMSLWPVSKDVGNVRNQGERLTESTTILDWRP